MLERAVDRLGLAAGTEPDRGVRPVDLLGDCAKQVACQRRVLIIEVLDRHAGSRTGRVPATPIGAVGYVAAGNRAGVGAVLHDRELGVSDILRPAEPVKCGVDNAAQVVARGPRDELVFFNVGAGGQIVCVGRGARALTDRLLECPDLPWTKLVVLNGEITRAKFLEAAETGLAVTRGNSGGGRTSCRG